MRIGQGGADVTQDAHRDRHRHRSPSGLEPLGQRLAFDIGHHEEHQPVAFVYGVDRDDVRMRQLRRGLGLLQEPPPDIRPEREIRRQQLDRNRSLEAPVYRPIHDPHAAATDLTIEVIGRRQHACDASGEGGLGGQRRISVRSTGDVRHRIARE